MHRYFFYNPPLVEDLVIIAMIRQDESQYAPIVISRFINMVRS